MKEQPHAKLDIEGEVLKCRNEKGAIVWELPISNIVLIAEYTTNEGPWIDDYFVHFWSQEDGRLFQSVVTFYADGRDEAIKTLSDRLGIAIELGLCNSTEWNSRVIWPRDLADHAYFQFREVEPKSWFQRIQRLCLGPSLEYYLSDEVRAFLRRFKPETQAS